MKRFDFARYEKIKKHAQPETRYYIFDRNYSTSMKLAVVYDVADAEMICDALNGAWETKKYERDNIIRRGFVSAQA